MDSQIFLKSQHDVIDRLLLRIPSTRIVLLTCAVVMTCGDGRGREVSDDPPVQWQTDVTIMVHQIEAEQGAEDGLGTPEFPIGAGTVPIPHCLQKCWLLFVDWKFSEKVDIVEAEGVDRSGFVQFHRRFFQHLPVVVGSSWYDDLIVVHHDQVPVPVHVPEHAVVQSDRTKVANLGVPLLRHVQRVDQTVQPQPSLALVVIKHACGVDVHRIIQVELGHAQHPVQFEPFYHLCLVDRAMPVRHTHTEVVQRLLVELSPDRDIRGVWIALFRRYADVSRDGRGDVQRASEGELAVASTVEDVHVHPCFVDSSPDDVRLFQRWIPEMAEGCDVVVVCQHHNHPDGWIPR